MGANLDRRWAYITTGVAAARDSTAPCGASERQGWPARKARWAITPGTRRDLSAKNGGLYGLQQVKR